MKNIIHVCFLFICLSVIAGCAESDPEPSCIQAEVIGPDCGGNGWYLLKLENDVSGKSNSYIGQLQSGFVTTNNLPDEYKQPGRKINVSVDLLEDDGPFCVAVYVMYPAVSVKKVCSAAPVKQEG